MKKAEMSAKLLAALSELGDSLAPLHVMLGNELEPRPAYLFLGEDEVGFRVAYSDGTPEAVWNGRVREWSLHPRLSADALRRLAEDDRVLSLLERVAAGLSVEWDGSNRVGRLSPDAAAAEEELGDLLEREYGLDGDLVPSYDADEVVWGVNVPSREKLAEVWPPEKSLDEAVSALEELARSEGFLVRGDLERVLLDALESLGDEDPDALTGEHRREYEARFAAA